MPLAPPSASDMDICPTALADASPGARVSDFGNSPFDMQRFVLRLQRVVFLLKPLHALHEDCATDSRISVSSSDDAGQ